MTIRFLYSATQFPARPLPDQIYGDFIFPDQSGQNQYNIGALALAEINGNVGAFGRNWQYNVDWAWTIRIVGDIPRSISAFAGFPERRYVGTWSTASSTYVCNDGQINYRFQQRRGGRFVATNIRSLFLDMLDVGGEVGVVTQTLARLSNTDLSVDGIQFAESAQDVCDTLRIFAFPGINYVVKIGYHAVGVTDFPTSTLWRQVSI